MSFALAALESALTANDSQMAYYFQGMGQALPVEVLPVFTPDEIETLMTGSARIDLDVLRAATDYHNCDESEPHIQCVQWCCLMRAFGRGTLTVLHLGCGWVSWRGHTRRYFWWTMSTLSQAQLSEFVNFSCVPTHPPRTSRR